MSWVILGLFSVISYGYAYLPDNEQYIAFLSVYSIHFLLYGILVLSHKANQVSILSLIIVAVLNRMLLWDTSPIFENDYFRYLWDGRVLANGINPYLHGPNSMALDHLTVWYRELIGWPGIKTIYPPLAEFYFATLHYIAGDSLLVLKLSLTILEVSTGLILLTFASNYSERKLLTILYFFNPLILKEIANSAHFDALPVFLSVSAVAVFIYKNNLKTFAWIILALATAAKSYPIVLVPLFLKLDCNWKKNISVYALVLSALYLPFLGAGTNMLSGIGTFSTDWLFNAGAFRVISMGTNIPIEILFSNWATSAQGAVFINSEYPGKIIAGLLLILYISMISKKLSSVAELPRAVLSVLGMLLILSPIVNAWYVLWLLPFACLEKSISYISFTFLVIASYSWFWSKEYAFLFRGAEYFIFFGLLAAERLAEGRKYSEIFNFGFQVRQEKV